MNTGVKEGLKKLYTKETADQYCKKCGNELEWHDCEHCGGTGFSHHDCGEDSCCCLYPEDNVMCDICLGEGGWCYCPFCQPGVE